MTKAQFVEKYAEKAGMNLRDAGAAVNAFFDTVSASVKEGEKIVIPGVVKIEPVKRAARTARNPQTGEMITVPEKIAIKAKFSDKLLG